MQIVGQVIKGTVIVVDIYGKEQTLGKGQTIVLGDTIKAKSEDAYVLFDTNPDPVLISKSDAIEVDEDFLDYLAAQAKKAQEGVENTVVEDAQGEEIQDFIENDDEDQKDNTDTLLSNTSINSIDLFDTHIQTLELTHDFDEKQTTQESNLQFALVGDNGQYYLRGSDTEKLIVLAHARNGTLSDADHDRHFDVLGVKRDGIAIDNINGALKHTSLPLGDSADVVNTVGQIIKTLDIFKDPDSKITDTMLQNILGVKYDEPLSAGELSYLNTRMDDEHLNPENSDFLTQLSSLSAEVYTGVLQPTDLDLISSSDSGASNTDNLTNDDTPTLSLTLREDASVGDIVTIYNNGTFFTTHTLTQEEVDTHSAHITLDTPTNGDYHLTASITDAHGHESTKDNSLTVTIDTTADTGDKVSIALSDASDNNDTINDGKYNDQAVDGDKQTNDKSPQMDLSGIDGDIQTVTVTFTDSADPVHTLTVEATKNQGVWTLPAKELTGFQDGEVKATVTVVDDAGNVNDKANTTFTLDTSADGDANSGGDGIPLSITLNGASDTGVKGDNQTNDTTPTLTLTGVDADVNTVTLFIKTRGAKDSTYQELEGKYDATAREFTPTNIDDGDYTIRVDVVDDAGNTATSLNPLDITVDTVVNVAASNTHDNKTNFYDLNLGSDVSDMYVIKMHDAKTNTDIITFTRELDADKHFTDNWTVTVTDGYGSTLSGTVTTAQIEAGVALNMGAGDPPPPFKDPLIIHTTDAAGNTVSSGTPAVMSGKTKGDVVEDANIHGDTASGTLYHHDDDKDDKDNLFQEVKTPTSSDNGYGTYTVVQQGTTTHPKGATWTYTLDDSNATVNALAEGKEITDTFIVHSGDGTPKTITITIKGTNDAPELTVSNIAATEDGAAVTGQASVSDVDTGDTHTYSVSTLAAGQGSVSINENGVYTYTIGKAFQSLGEGKTATVSFYVTATDNHGGSDTETVEVTITGTNDAPELTVSNIAATEDGAEVTGKASISDDNGDTHTYSVSTLAAGEGSVSINENGVYTYTIGEAFQSLGEGKTTTVSFDVTATDNHGESDTKPVTVTITGKNDAAVITGDFSGSITEDASSTTVNGTVKHTDVDANNNDNVFQEVLASTATYGSYTVSTAGVWEYTLNNENTAVQALGAYDSNDENTYLTDTITVTAQDGTTKDVTVTIQGANDAPTTEDNTIDVDEGSSHTFTKDDFKFSGGDTGDTLHSITISTLPTNGTLTLDGAPVRASQVITVENIENLVFAPNGDNSANFTFHVSDGTAQSTEAKTITLNVKDTTPPTVDITSSMSTITDNALTYTFEFSEKVKGFDVNDITVNGGSIVDNKVTKNNDGTYSIEVIPSINYGKNIKDLTVTVRKSAVIDENNNLNEGKSLTEKIFVDDDNNSDEDNNPKDTTNYDYIFLKDGVDRLELTHYDHTKIDYGKGNDTLIINTTDKVDLSKIHNVEHIIVKEDDASVKGTTGVDTVVIDVNTDHSDDLELSDYTDIENIEIQSLDTMMGTSNDDKITLKSDDFNSIDLSAGNDTLIIDTTDKINLSKLHNIENITLNSGAKLDMINISTLIENENNTIIITDFDHTKDTNNDHKKETVSLDKSDFKDTNSDGIIDENDATKVHHDGHDYDHYTSSDGTHFIEIEQTLTLDWQ